MGLTPMLKCDDYDIFAHLRFILYKRGEVSDVKNLKLFTPKVFANPYDQHIFSEALRNHMIFIHYNLKYCLLTRKDIADCEKLLRLKCDTIDDTCEKIRDFYQNEMKYDEKLSSYRTKSLIMGLLKFIYNLESINLFPYYVSLLPIPVNKALNYKIGICTEYAKITSAILSQLYPNSDVFLFFTPSHVATGLLTDDDFLIIDQNSPLYILEDWIQEQHSVVSVYFLNTECEEPILVSNGWISVNNGKLIYSLDLISWKEYDNYERSNRRNIREPDYF